MEFSRQECWTGLPCLPSGDLPDPGIELMALTSPASGSPAPPPPYPLGTMKLSQLRTSELQGGPAGHSDDMGITHWFPDCFSRQILRASSLQPSEVDGGRRAEAAPFTDRETERSHVPCPRSHCSCRLMDASWLLGPLELWMSLPPSASPPNEFF